MNVLIVKLTSMGDLVHALPAVTDAVNAIPHIHFDWVVDEAFADIPKLHPRIENVITTAHRRWQREKWKTFKNKELVNLWHNVRKKKYDIVIDAQNNLKSALVTSITRGKRCGMDRNSAREKFAHLVCDKTFAIPIDQHAIVRQRQLFAQALNYAVPNTFPDFGVIQEKLPPIPVTLPKPYLVFIHSTTWDTKHWPEAYWQQLIKIATQAGYHIALPWGNAVEQARAEKLAAGASATTVLPRLSIMQQATLISQSAGAVCVDTGLGHLTAALNKPAVHLYGPTDPGLIGATGRNQLHLIAEYECAPCYLHECKFGKESACFLKNMHPEKVWENFLAQLSMS
ncbi:MAG: lipopolysaccharide heptosyltransferase I [Gammaproteobacteria bacterium]